MESLSALEDEINRQLQGKLPEILDLLIKKINIDIFSSSSEKYQYLCELYAILKRMKSRDDRYCGLYKQYKTMRNKMRKTLPKRVVENINVSYHLGIVKSLVKRQSIEERVDEFDRMEYEAWKNS